jgi:hypothetical protein
MPKAITEGEVRSCIEDDKEYELIKYNGIGNKTKHTVKHSCGYQYSVDYAHFKRGQRCPDCFGNRATTITKEEIEQHLFNEGYKLLKYNGKGIGTIHEFEHILCGHKYPSDYNRFKNGGYRCQKCAGNLPITKEQIEQHLSEEGYKLLRYDGIGNQTKHIIEHIQCGFQYSVCYSNFKRYSGCPNCAGKAVITKERIELYLLEEGYRLIQYNGRGNRTKHIAEHMLCGYNYPVTWSTFWRGERCPDCFGSHVIPKEIVKNCFEEEREYKLIKYNGIGNQTKHIVEHIQCGLQYPVDYNHFKHRNQRCPNCSKSRTENLCRKTFESLFPNYKFPNSRPNFLQGLELDGYCSELHLAFEYNGIQHYEVVDFFPDSQEQLKERQEHDRRKLELCAQQGINVCVIPYMYDCYEPKKLDAFIKVWVFGLDLPLHQI